MFVRNGEHALIGDGCASENYDYGIRSRSAYDELLPGHETAAEWEVRSKRIAELEETIGHAREMLRAGKAIEAETMLSGMRNVLDFNHEGFLLWIEASVMANRERQATNSWLPRRLFD